MQPHASRRALVYRWSAPRGSTAVCVGGTAA